MILIAITIIAIITTSIITTTYSIEEILQTITMEFTKDGEIENYDLQDGKLDLECITPHTKF